MAKITPDTSDPTRCISVHWQLPAQCKLPSSHRENWHETTHPETGYRMRYRYPGRLTQVLHNDIWRPVNAPREPFDPIGADEERALRILVADGVGGFSNRAVGRLLAELDFVRQLHGHSWLTNSADGEPTDEPCECGMTYAEYDATTGERMAAATAESEASA